MSKQLIKGRFRHEKTFNKGKHSCGGEGNGDWMVTSSQTRAAGLQVFGGNWSLQRVTVNVTHS